MSAFCKRWMKAPSEKLKSVLLLHKSPSKTKLLPHTKQLLPCTHPQQMEVMEKFLLSTQMADGNRSILLEWWVSRERLNFRLGLHGGWCTGQELCNLSLLLCDGGFELPDAVLEVVVHDCLHGYGCESKIGYGSLRGDPYYGSGMLT